MRVNSFGDGQTRVLLALRHVYALTGRASMRDVAAGAGLSLTTTKKHLDALRAEGLVAWDESTNGTLRPLMETVW